MKHGFTLWGVSQQLSTICLFCAASCAGALWRLMAADHKQKGKGLGVKNRINAVEGASAVETLMKVVPSTNPNALPTIKDVWLYPPSRLYNPDWLPR